MAPTPAASVSVLYEQDEPAWLSAFLSNARLSCKTLTVDLHVTAISGVAHRFMNASDRGVDAAEGMM